MLDDLNLEYLNRDLQREILKALARRFPNEVTGSEIQSLCAAERSFKSKFSMLVINNALQYLSEHGLVTLVIKYKLSGDVSTTRITAKGLDFLADDGGLSAILNVVTVKLHGDTIRELMIAKVEASNDDPTVKKNLIKKLKELPADAMEKLSMGLLEIGISKVPDLIKWLSTSNIL